jgi:hypothetical protein
MSAFALSAASGSGRRKPRLEDRLIARMLGRSLDRELASGVAARISEAHAARVGQLTAGRTRRAVARSLDRLIEQAEAPASRFQITAAPCREQVREATGMLRATATRLRSAELLDARGIARLKTLLSDPLGPCYAESGPDALALALHDIAKSLDVDD